MSVLRIVFPILLLASTGCGAFGSGRAVELGTAGEVAGAQWNAALSSPASMAGILQMTGTATMAPSADSARTILSVRLANASPGGLHPWEVRSGACGATSRATVFGSADEYEALSVRSDGRANSTVVMDARIPASGPYSVVVRASATNYATIVACGNLAGPTR